MPFPLAVQQTAAQPEPAAATPSKADLTASKVIAGGMAAATSAIFGSYFGAFGTVAGAAFGSVATTVSTNLYQRSLERTRDSVRTGVRKVTRRSGDAPDPGAPPTANIYDAPTVQLEPKARRRSARLLVVGTLMIFLLGLGLVTGLEWAKGSPISGGENGTSIGRVLKPKPTPTPTPTPEPTPPPSDGASDSESSRPEDSRDPDEQREPDPSVRPSIPGLPDGGLLPSPRSERDDANRVRPSAPELVPGLRHGESGGLFPDQTR